jgi:hypothetical protein
MPGPITSPVPVPTKTTCSRKRRGVGVGVGAGSGRIATVICRVQRATWSPLVTRTVASYTPMSWKTCGGFGLVENSPSPKDHRNS